MTTFTRVVIVLRGCVFETVVIADVLLSCTFASVVWFDARHCSPLHNLTFLSRGPFQHPLSVVCDWSIHHISRLKWLWAKSTQWSIVQIDPATFCTAAWVGSNLISRAVCGSGVWRCPWARRLTLTAPEELTVALRGWLCHHCVNGWMLAYIVKHWLATS